MIQFHGCSMILQSYPQIIKSLYNRASIETMNNDIYMQFEYFSL